MATKKAHKPRNRTKVEKLVNDLSLELTGARPGDIVAGIRNASKHGVLRIHTIEVKPRKRVLDDVRAYPDLWSRFLEKLASLEFFRVMSVLERREWLEKNQVEHNKPIGANGTILEIIQLGSNMSEKMTSEKRDKLLAMKRCTHQDIAAATSPLKTLYLLREYWRVTIYYKLVRPDKVTVSTIDLRTGRLHAPTSARTLRDSVLFQLPDITAEVVQKKTNLRWIPSDKTQSVCISVPSDACRGRSRIADPKCTKRVKAACSKFTLAAYKSLLQKIIRFRPKLIDLEDGKPPLPAEEVLVVVMRIMETHPGSFVPDIQRFVSGIEALAKRLAVIVVEDSYSPQPNDIVSLLAGALLAQRTRRVWKPSPCLMDYWIAIATRAYLDNRAVLVDIEAEKTKRPYVVQLGQHPLETASALLDELKSFDSDLALMRGWARYANNGWVLQGKSSVKVGATVRPSGMMPLAHCVDQHWAPGFVHFIALDYVNRLSPSKRDSTPFGPIMKAIWDTCSSINPRKVDVGKDFEISVKELRDAQRLYLRALQTTANARRVLPGRKFQLTHRLNNGWLAGLVGGIPVARNPKKYIPVNMIVTLSTDDPHRLIAIQSPSRTMKKVDDEKMERAKQVAIGIVRDRLRSKSGLPMNQARPPHSSLKGARVFLQDKTYLVGKTRRSAIPWSKVRDLKLYIDIHADGGLHEWTYAIKHRGSGKGINADYLLKKLVATTDPKYIRRAQSLLSGFEPMITIPRVNRDGGATQEAVTLSDIGAFQFLMSLAYLFPGAISPRPHRPSIFDVRVAPLMWEMRKNLTSVFQKTHRTSFACEEGDEGGATKTCSKWPPFKDADNRNMWPHQLEIVSEMMNRHINRKQKGHFIWATVGLGKTLAVLHFLRQIHARDELAPYIVYTLPQSAMQSIVNEIAKFGIPINLIVPLKVKKKGIRVPKNATLVVANECNLKAYHINLIEHDHFRRCSDVLQKTADNTMLIVDEVHKTLNATLRTANIQSMASLARNFVVLTGTPVIDSKTEKLIPWLRNVVSFEVNDKNFYTAANAMVAKLVRTTIEVVDTEAIAPFTETEKKAYLSHVPILWGGTKMNPRQEDFRQAVELCYEVCNREMIQQTIRYIRSGRGVMLVAKDARHQEKLHDMVLKTGITPIYSLKGTDSIELTYDAVRAGEQPDYKVVIVPQRKAEGYTLTRLSVMVTSVYPGNNATREQLRGRINRISQKHDTVTYVTVHNGILTRILANHAAAKNLQQALKGMVKAIKHPHQKD